MAGGAGPSTLHTDPIKLKVVIKNLIGNARKFTEHGSIRVCVSLAEPGVHIAVQDTGSGIEVEALPIIFEPFRQADHVTTRRARGLGLGLYIVRRFVDLLGGTIHVESALGHGSTFTVALPLDAAQSPTRSELQTLVPRPFEP